MINQSILITVFTVAMPCGVPYCVGQSNVVFYGTNASSIGVSFVDTNLSVSAQASIVTDLQICLNEWGNKSELRLRNKENSAGYFYNSTQCPHYPENIKFPENVVTNTNGPILQISKTLSDAYTNAFAFATANSNIVAAAHEFVTFVASTNFGSVASNQISNYFLFNQAPPVLYQIAFEDITNSWRNQTFYQPSVLSFHYSSTGPAPTNLWMFVPSSCPSTLYNGVTIWNQLPSIWHDGKWKFCNWEENPHYELPQ